MDLKRSLFAIVTACLLFPAMLIAGGPPWLCLPIDGVTTDNREECTRLLTTQLKGKIWMPEPGVKILRSGNQQYLTLYMDKDVALSEVDAVLKNTGFSIPRDNLRLYGHVILEIDIGAAAQNALLTDLDALNYVFIEESEDKADRLMVTVEMPYPKRRFGEDGLAVDWDMFQWADFGCDRPGGSESPATPKTLPEYKTIHAIVAKHGASLKDIRWSSNFVCRSLGCVILPDPNIVISPEVALAVGTWKVEFTNGVTEVCIVGKSGTAAVDEPRRRSLGTITGNGGSIIMTFNDDRIERWTRVGRRFVVEHWYPGARFPSANPVLGIADRTE